MNFCKREILSSFSVAMVLLAVVDYTDHHGTKGQALVIYSYVPDADDWKVRALKVIAEAETAGMLSSAGSPANVHRRPLIVKTGFRGRLRDDFEPDILDRFFGKPIPNVRVIR